MGNICSKLDINTLKQCHVFFGWLMNHLRVKKYLIVLDSCGLVPYIWKQKLNWKNAELTWKCEESYSSKTPKQIANLIEQQAKRFDFYWGTLTSAFTSNSFRSIPIIDIMVCFKNLLDFLFLNLNRNHFSVFTHLSCLCMLFQINVFSLRFDHKVYFEI